MDNGLLLRSDLHRLYDRGYVTVTPDYEFRVGKCLWEEFRNGRVYYDLHDRPITVPENALWKPKRERLEWHQAEVFKG